MRDPALKEALSQNSSEGKRNYRPYTSSVLNLAQKQDAPDDRGSVGGRGDWPGGRNEEVPTRRGDTGEGLKAVMGQDRERWKLGGWGRDGQRRAGADK